MVPTEMRGVQYLAPENQVLVPPNFTLLHSDISNLHLDTLLSNLPNCYFNSAGHEFVPPHPPPPPTSCLSSNNSTSDEADEHQLSIIDERRQRRMISNRESARRSRMRKQKHLDELWSQVVRLRNENHNLIDKLNHASESHERVLHENARLKEEASDLRQMLADLRIGTPFASSTTRDFNEAPCNTPLLRHESSTQSITSEDLLLK